MFSLSIGVSIKSQFTARFDYFCFYIVIFPMAIRMLIVRYIRLRVKCFRGYDSRTRNLQQTVQNFVILCKFRSSAPHGTARNKRCIYTTFILGTALQNFGTRVNNKGHGPLHLCRVKANFSARVSKNLGRPRPPQEVVGPPKRRSACQNQGYLYHCSYVLCGRHVL